MLAGRRGWVGAGCFWAALLVAAAVSSGGGCGNNGVPAIPGAGTGGMNPVGTGGVVGLGGAGGAPFGGGGFGGSTTLIGGAPDGGGAGGATTATDPGDAQTPPMGEANMMAWLATNQYKSWHCQGGTHPPNPPSTHGTSRECSNKLMSGAGAGEYPVGSAAVIELYDNAGQVRGHAVSRHVAAGSDPTTWYWYSDLEGVFFGDGLAYGSCSTCHAGAGAFGATGHDYVFIQVH